VEAVIRKFENPLLRITEEEGEGKLFARQAIEDGFDLIIAAGGDGTVNEVVNGIVPNAGRTRLGILPLGTGNDLARSLDVPTDLSAAVDIILAGETRRVDVIKVVNSSIRYFINMSSCGFSGQVDENLTPEMKQAWGGMAYLMSGLGTLPELTPYKTHIQFDDYDPEELDLYNLVIANARYVGGGIQVAPAAKLNDGLIDVMIIPVTSTPRLILAMTEILLGRHLDSDIVIHRRARKVSFNSYPNMWINVDGELIGREPATFEVLDDALEIITGPDPEAF
jgi:diacylglycerol kinase (ATP)